MKRKVLASLLVIAVVAGLVGAATWAAFSDEEVSENNLLIAGTLDLQTNFSSPIISDMDNMKPGDSLVDVEITYTNIGSLDGDASWTFDYNEDDCTPPTGFEFTVGKTADDVAKALLITGAQWDNGGGGGYISVQTDWESYAAHHDGNSGNLSVYDLKAAGTWDDTNTMSQNEMHKVKFTITFDDVGNDYQCDGINATVTVTLNQL